MATPSGGLPLRTALILLTATTVALTASLATFHETRRPVPAILTFGTAFLGTAAFFDWLLL